MKRIVPVVLAVLVLALGLAGCSKYVTHYSAIGHATTNDSDSASMSFMEFDGTEVFKLKCSGDQAAIRYSGQLETGAQFAQAQGFMGRKRQPGPRSVRYAHSREDRT